MIVKHEYNRQVAVDPRMVQDARLSWGATGMLLFLASLDEDRDLAITRLDAFKRDGATGSRSVLRELEEAGWVIRRRVIGPNNQAVDGLIVTLPQDEVPKVSPSDARTRRRPPAPPSPPLYTKFKKYFSAKWYDRYHKPYPWHINPGRDGKAIKQMLRVLDTQEKIERSIDAYIASDHPAQTENMHLIHIMQSTLQRWVRGDYVPVARPDKDTEAVIDSLLDEVEQEESGDDESEVSF